MGFGILGFGLGSWPPSKYLSRCKRMSFQYEHDVSPASLLLLEAVRNRDLSMAIVAIDMDADVNTRGTQSTLCTPLTRATALNDLDMIELLLDRGACIDYRNRDDELAIQVAIKKMNESALSLLVGRQASVNGKTIRGVPLLTIACQSSSLAVVNLLLESQADTNAYEFSSGTTAIFYAASRGYTNFVRTFLLYEADVDVIPVRYDVYY